MIEVVVWGKQGYETVPIKDEYEEIWSRMEWIRVIKKNKNHILVLIHDPITSGLFVLTVQNINMKNNKVLSHTSPFMITEYARWKTKSYHLIVSEYCQKGNLNDLLTRNHCIEESRMQFMAAQLVVALHQLHLQHQVYRHLEMKNVMLFKKDIIKLKSSSSKYNTAPEEKSIGNNNATMSGDWWAMGILMYQCLTGNRFKEEEEMKMFPLIFPPHLSESACDFVENLLQVDPLRRLGTNDIFDVYHHSFFTHIDFEVLLCKAKGEIL